MNAPNDMGDGHRNFIAIDESIKAMTTVMSLAGWIGHNYNYKDPITHLKLQKLVFYCYGAILSKDLENEIGSPIIFEPWEHGPVNRILYREFRDAGPSPISTFPEPGKYSEDASEVLESAITIYGALDAWPLRQQSHLESIWKESYDRKELRIDPQSMKHHFKKKFAKGQTQAPEYVFGLSSFRIDGIPMQSYDDLSSLAKAVQRVYSGIKTK